MKSRRRRWRCTTTRFVRDFIAVLERWERAMGLSAVSALTFRTNQSWKIDRSHHERHRFARPTKVVNSNTPKGSTLCCITNFRVNSDPRPRQGSVFRQIIMHMYCIFTVSISKDQLISTSPSAPGIASPLTVEFTSSLRTSGLI